MTTFVDLIHAMQLRFYRHALRLKKYKKATGLIPPEMRHPRMPVTGNFDDKSTVELLSYKEVTPRKFEPFRRASLLNIAEEDYPGWHNAVWALEQDR